MCVCLCLCCCRQSHNKRFPSSCVACIRDFARVRSDSSADMWFDCCWSCYCSTVAVSGWWCCCCLLLCWRWERLLCGRQLRRYPSLYHQLPTLGGCFEETLQPEFVYTLTVHDQIGRHHWRRKPDIFSPQRRNNRGVLLDAFLEAPEQATEPGNRRRLRQCFTGNCQPNWQHLIDFDIS